MIVSVVNNKGGVGKTTASINLSSALAKKKNKVLLIDMDSQAHSTYGLGIKPDNERKSIGDVMMSGTDNRFIFYYQKSIKDIIIATPRKNLFLVPSNSQMIEVLAPLYKANRFFKAQKYDMLSQSLQCIVNDYDYIIIDCPPGLNVLTLNSVKASDAVLVPCETSSGSILGLHDLLIKVKELKGDSFENYQILYTMMDQRCKSSVKLADAQLAKYGKRLLKTKILRSDLFNQAQFQMKDIFAFAPNSMAAKSYLKLAVELTKEWGIR